ncbi:MAG TPA: cytochrome c oxidase subunit 3 [Nitrococcus sp.]|nr:cytochrome c oxidase subunit 3 [Nitrococcus sp.]
MARPLPIGTAGRRTAGWWGVVMLIGTEAAVFAYLFFSYYYLASQTDNVWPPTGPLPLRYSAPTTAALILSSFSIWWADRSIRRGRRLWLFIGLVISLLLGVLYIILQLLDWQMEPFALNSGAYGSLFYTITGFHMVHAIAGILIFATLILWSALGHVSSERHESITIAALYWYFIMVVWIGIFITFYILPYAIPS